MEFCLKKRNIARKVSYVSINTNFTDAYHFIAKLSNKRTSNVWAWVFFAIGKCKRLHKLHFVLVIFKIVLIFC